MGFSQSKPWFDGGDEAFYRYLEDRLQSTGINRPAVDRNGENVLFEFWVTDSGYVDSVKIGTCFNIMLCQQLRLILNTMPRVNATMADGKPVPSRRLYSVIIRLTTEGYRVEPLPPPGHTGQTSQRFKWGVVIAAVVALLVVVAR